MNGKYVMIRQGTVIACLRFYPSKDLRKLQKVCQDSSWVQVPKIISDARKLNLIQMAIRILIL
jgi:hypothetical protein